MPKNFLFQTIILYKTVNLKSCCSPIIDRMSSAMTFIPFLKDKISIALFKCLYIY